MIVLYHVVIVGECLVRLTELGARGGEVFGLGLDFGCVLDDR